MPLCNIAFLNYLNPDLIGHSTQKRLILCIIKKIEEKDDLSTPILSYLKKRKHVIKVF